MNILSESPGFDRGSSIPVVSRLLFLLFGLLLSTASAVNAEIVRMPLEKFLGKKIAHMRCNKSTFSIYLPIPERWKINKATINFRFVSSPTLIPEGSMIAVRVNSKPVWTQVLGLEEPEQSVLFEIPQKLLGHKYNEISFFVGQHFSFECEHPCDPNLWTDIDFHNAYIEIDYDPLPVPLVLSKAHNFLFDNKTFERGNINIVIPGGHADASDTMLTTATVLASGIAKRFDYVPVTFSVSDKIKPGVDNIMIGVGDDIRNILPANIPTDISGPSIKIAKLPLGKIESTDIINTFPISEGHSVEEDKEEAKSNIQKSEAREAIDKWLDSWTNEEIKSYAGFYSLRFISEQGEKQKSYIQKKKDLFNKIGMPIITISDISIVPQGKKTQAVFMQKYRLASLVGKKWERFKHDGWKELVWVKEGSELKILSEKWSREKPPVQLEEKVVEKLPAKKLKKLVHDDDPTHALIILSGKSEDDIKLATEALISLTFPYPGVSEMEVLEFKVNDIKTYSGKAVLETGKPTKFQKLGFHTKTFIGLLPAPKDLSFNLPPDFDIKPNQYAKLSLNFVYSGGLRADSGLNILLNGVFATTISFDNPKGATLEDYEISIPTYLFKPGKNKVSFKPVMIPDSEECQLVLPESLVLTIHDNSELSFPKMPHFVKMPNIALFMLNGYPFTVWPDGSNTLIVLSDKDNPALEAAMNTVGMISQNNGFPLFSINVRKNMPDKWNGNIMVFGTIASLMDEVAGNSELSLKNITKVPYPFSKNPMGETFAQIRQISDIGANRGLILEFKSPYGNNKTAILFSAETEEDLAKLGLAMTDAGVQEKGKKDFVIVDFNKPGYEVSSLTTEKAYYIGANSILQKGALYFYTHPNALYIVGGILLVMLIMSTIMMYRNILVRKASEEDPEVGRSVLGVFAVLKKALLFFFIARKLPQKDDEEK